MHLGNAHPLGYLRLREVLLETQAEYQPLARGQCLQRAAQRLAYLDALVPVLVVGERIGERPALLLPAARAGRVERHRLVGRGGLHRLEHVLHGRLHRRRDVARRGRPAELGREVAQRLPDLEDQLLRGPRDVHRPSLVAEVALDLAEHRRHRVPREAVAALRVVPVHRLDEAHACHLHEVLQRLARVAIPGRELPGERHEAQHELVTSLEITCLVIALKEPVVRESPCLRRLSRRLPQQDGWCHVSHITLSGRCETWWGRQVTADASSTISSRSSKRVMANTRCTASGPRTITTRRPASRARSSAVTRQRSPVESRNDRRDRSSTSTGGSPSSTRRSSSCTLATVERSSSPFSATCTSPLRSSVSTSRISTCAGT